MPEVLDITLGEMVRVVHKGFPNLLMADPDTVGYKDRPIKFVPASQNLREQPLRLAWDGRMYHIPYMGDAYIPFDCMKMYFGDPRSGQIVNRIRDKHNQDQVIPDRLAEVQRLRYYWQETDVRFREFIPGDRTLLDEPISDRIPDVEVYALTGDRIFTVIDDPHGDRIIAATPTIAQDQARDAQLLQQSEVIVNQQRTIEALMRKLGVRPEDLELEEGTDVDTDRPSPRRRAGRQTAPTQATVKENPAMVYDQRTQKVRAKPDSPAAPDPTQFDELPVDGT